jgi:hypothetical protein
MNGASVHSVSTGMLKRDELYLQQGGGHFQPMLQLRYHHLNMYNKHDIQLRVAWLLGNSRNNYSGFHRIFSFRIIVWHFKYRYIAQVTNVPYDDLGPSGSNKDHWFESQFVPLCSTVMALMIASDSQSHYTGDNSAYHEGDVKTFLIPTAGDRRWLVVKQTP